MNKKLILILAGIVLLFLGSMFLCGPILFSIFPSIISLPGSSTPIALPVGPTGMIVEADERDAGLEQYAEELKEALPEEWLAHVQAKPRYKLLISVDQTDLNTCQFVGYTQYNERIDVEVNLIDLNDNQILTSKTFFGRQEEIECQHEIIVFSGETSGTNYFSADQDEITQWLLATLPVFISDHIYSEAEISQHFYEVHRTISTGQTNIKINQIQYPTGDEYHQPKKGYKFLVVDITIKNTSTSPIKVSTSEMSVVDSSGKKYLYNIDASIVLSNDLWVGGEIAPGEENRGLVGFQVPEDATGMFFVINADYLGSETIYVIIP